MKNRKTKLDPQQAPDNQDFQEQDPNKPLYKFFIPIIIHNLSSYDARIIFKYFNPRVAAKHSQTDEVHPPNVEIVGLNLEKFI